MPIVLVIQQVYVCADYLDSWCDTQTFIQAHECASVHHHDWHLSREVTWEVPNHRMHHSRADFVTHVYMSKDLFVDTLEKWISAGTKVFSKSGRNKVLRPKFNDHKSYRVNHRDFWDMMSGVRWGLHVRNWIKEAFSRSWNDTLFSNPKINNAWLRVRITRQKLVYFQPQQILSIRHKQMFITMFCFSIQNQRAWWLENKIQFVKKKKMGWFWERHQNERSWDWQNHIKIYIYIYLYFWIKNYFVYELYY